MMSCARDQLIPASAPQSSRHTGARARRMLSIMGRDMGNLGSPYPGARLMRVEQILPGDIVRFRARFADYVVDDVVIDSLGRPCHIHGDGAASSSYEPGEMLWVTVNTWGM